MAPRSARTHLLEHDLCPLKHCDVALIGLVQGRLPEVLFPLHNVQKLLAGQLGQLVLAAQLLLWVRGEGGGEVRMEGGREGGRFRGELSKRAEEVCGPQET
jgi:hypothetical protein